MVAQQNLPRYIPQAATRFGLPSFFQGPGSLFEGLHCPVGKPRTGRHGDAGYTESTAGNGRMSILRCICICLFNFVGKSICKLLYIYIYIINSLYVCVRALIGICQLVLYFDMCIPT